MFWKYLYRSFNATKSGIDVTNTCRSKVGFKASSLMICNMYLYRLSFNLNILRYHPWQKKIVWYFFFMCPEKRKLMPRKFCHHYLSKNRPKLCISPIYLDMTPVPLNIFRSNSKFDENSERSSFEYTRPVTMIFCTCHDSDTVVTCAKYRCDRPRIFYTRVFWIFLEFRIRSKYV